MIAITALFNLTAFSLVRFTRSPAPTGSCARPLAARDGLGLPAALLALLAVARRRRRHPRSGGFRAEHRYPRLAPGNGACLSPAPAPPGRPRRAGVPSHAGRDDLRPCDQRGPARQPQRRKRGQCQRECAGTHLSRARARLALPAHHRPGRPPPVRLHRAARRRGFAADGFAPRTSRLSAPTATRSASSASSDTTCAVRPISCTA